MPFGYLGKLIQQLESGEFEGTELNLTRTSLGHELLQNIISIVLKNDITIETILLEETEDLNDESAHLLSQLKSLKEIDIGLNRLGPQGAEHLASLPNLETLDIGSNRIEDAGLFALAQNQSLKTLRAVDCGLSKEGIEKVLALPNLTLTALDVFEGIDHPVSEEFQKEVTERLAQPQKKRSKQNLAESSSPLHKARQHHSCRTQSRDEDNLMGANHAGRKGHS